MITLHFKGSEYPCKEGESVLEALSRQGAEIPYSCRKGVCQICLMRSVNGAAGESAQRGLRDTLRKQGYFLSCQCMPSSDMHIAQAQDGQLFGTATIIAKDMLSDRVCRVRLEPEEAVDFHAGQFINLRRSDGVTRSYSIASVPRLDRWIELHVERYESGAMSRWICDALAIGDKVQIQGPMGHSFYLAGRENQPLLLIGTGTGLAPILGIARDALESRHAGPIHLYHGSRDPGGLYCLDQLNALAQRFGNFSFYRCLSGKHHVDGCKTGRAAGIALATHRDLSTWRVYLCGNPQMVYQTQKTAYLAGASTADIYTDPFELRDLRKMPRETVQNSSGRSA